MIRGVPPLRAGPTAEALIGIRRALDGLLLLVDPARNIPVPRSAGLSVPDLLPALVNAVRVFVTIGAVELFWITTAWPNGAGAIAFDTITPNVPTQIFLVTGGPVVLTIQYV